MTEEFCNTCRRTEFDDGGTGGDISTAGTGVTPQ